MSRKPNKRVDITSSDAPKRKQYSAPALDKGLDIIECLSRSASSMNLSDIAKDLDRSTSEIFRMLMVLEQRGYVALDYESDKYHLTLKLFEVVHKHKPIKRLTTAASPLMRQLALDTDQSSHLAIRNGLNMMVVAQQNSYGDRGFSVRVGATASIFESCSGNILYAFSDNTTQLGIIKGFEATPSPSTDTTEIERTAQKIRKKGFYKINSRQISGVIDIGYPIFDYSGSIAGCLIVPFLKHIDGNQKASLSETQKATASASKAISKTLGYEF